MRIQFTEPYLLLLLLPALCWVFWFAWKSDVQLTPWRRWTALSIRTLVVLAIGLAIAGLQLLHKIEGMNVFFVLDRSDSVPSSQQEAAREYVNTIAKQKKAVDKAGVVVFGSEASIETMPDAAVDLKKIQAVVGTERTDLAAAIRLGTAAFPETGQKRLVLLTDGNENAGDAMSAALAGFQQLGVSVDVVPLGVARANDVSVQKLQLPPKLKKGQAFEVKIFVQAEQATPATIRLFRNDQFLGEQKVELSAGKNLFAFPQVLPDPGYYSYDVQVDVPGDPLPQNNRASAFATVAAIPASSSSRPIRSRTRPSPRRSSPPGFKPAWSVCPASPARWARCNPTTPSSSATSPPATSASTARNCSRAPCAISASAWSASAATKPTPRAAIAARRSNPRCR